MITKTIPNLFTIANLFLGILAIVLAFQEQPDLAALMVIIALLTDGLDGKIARALNAQSEFGKELDSLSDVISFGVAPAMIMYAASFQYLGPAGLILTAIFPIFGALRLARFNVHNSSAGHFVGLPIPAAGGVLSMLALFHADLPALFLMIVTVALSFLMISNVQYPSFKKAGLSNKIVWTFGIFCVLAAIWFHFQGQGEYSRYLLAPLLLYAILGLRKNVIILLRRRKKSQCHHPAEDPYNYKNPL